MKSKAKSTEGATSASPPSLRRPSHRLTWPTWLLLFAVALGARAGWGTYRLIHAVDLSILEFPDEDQYWSMARSLRAGEGLTDELGFHATRMPLYPGFLSLFAGNAGGIVCAKASHWLLGALAATLAAAFAAAVAGRTVGLVTGLLVALDPFLVFFSSLLLTETFFIAALTGLWWVAWPMIRLHATSDLDGPGRWLVVGSLAALCVFLRPSSLGLLVAALSFILVCRSFDRRAWAGIGVVAGVVVVSLAPWAVRNRQVTGDWCWLTNRAGISLYDGVGPGATGSSDLGGIKRMPAVRELDETTWNRYFLTESFRTMREDPPRILRLALVKIGRTWNPVPNVETYRSPLPLVVSALWTLFTFAFAVIGAIILSVADGRSGQRLVVFLLLPALYFTALHSLFVGSVRYRLPALPMLGILAAVGLSVMLGQATEWWARRRSVGR